VKACVNGELLACVSETIRAPQSEATVEKKSLRQALVKACLNEGLVEIVSEAVRSPPLGRGRSASRDPSSPAEGLKVDDGNDDRLASDSLVRIGAGAGRAVHGLV
jgi:hypothetical protein